MKQFFKIVLGSCLGTLLFLGLVILIFMGIGLSQSGNSDIKDKSILTIDLNGITPEKTNNVQRSQFDFESPEAIGLRHTQRLIENAKTDDRIEGILIKNTGAPGGRVGLKVIRESLEDFKTSDKFLYSYGDFYTQNGYYLSSVADSVFINPNGTIDLKGFGAMIPYFRELMDKYGIDMNVFYVGKFKSATESFRRNDMSPENRVQTRKYLDNALSVMVDAITADRNISKEALTEFMDEYKGLDIEEITNNNLVDDVVFWNQMESKLKKQTGIKENKKLRFVDFAKYKNAVKLKSKSTSKDKIAIVYAEGEIGYNSEENGIISNDRYINIFRKLDRAKDLKAVVLRVNSPGGSALTSDLILQEVIDLQKKGIPVIASYGDYAASGGYYISCSADAIVSEPNTLTGSIGVFGMIPNVSKFVDEKLNINFDTIKTNDFALGLNMMYPMTDKEKQKVQVTIEQMYKKFLTRVSTGRGMDYDNVHEIAQGRVWCGVDALEIGLVDEIGNLDRAIELAAEKANLEDYKLVEYPKIKENPFVKIMNEIAQQDVMAYFNPLSKEEKVIVKKYKDMSKIMTQTQPQARMQYMIME